MDFEIDRARRYYRESAPLLNLIQPKARPSLWALIAIYSNLLDHIAESQYDVLTRRISLSTGEKILIVLPRRVAHLRGTAIAALFSARHNVESRHYVDALGALFCSFLTCLARATHYKSSAYLSARPGTHA